jgi:hypothetical protein
LAEILMAIWMRAGSFGTQNQDLTQSTQTIIIVFLSLALYNVIELICIILGTFKRHVGVYFWSFVAATLGIVLNCTGFFIKFLRPPSLGYLSCTLSLLGWVLMVTGQSMVLWSRLHLVMLDERCLKIVLCIIIFNAVVLHGTIIPMVYGSFSGSPEKWLRPYSIAERVEVVTFFLQEAMLSILYISQTVALMQLQLQRSLGNAGPSRRLMKHLILVNVLVIILDMTILALEFANQYDLQIAYKPFAYSIKLKLEFTVLNRLVDLANASWELR